jgi:hypothetical protein
MTEYLIKPLYLHLPLFIDVENLSSFTPLVIIDDLCIPPGIRSVPAEWILASFSKPVTLNMMAKMNLTFSRSTYFAASPFTALGHLVV